MGRPTIGVLSLQGSVQEHLAALARLDGVRPMPVQTLDALQQIDGLILPGGESTTLSRLLRIFSLMEPLKARILAGMPVWGTCAGMILMANRLVSEPAHLGVMDIAVRRNAFGRQIDSFRTEAVVPEVSPHPLPLVFIRAPWVESAGAGVRILCRTGGHITAVRQGRMLATAFHPELTGDLSFHLYFSGMVQDALQL